MYYLFLCISSPYFCEIFDPADFLCGKSVTKHLEDQENGSNFMVIVGFLPQLMESL